MALTLPRAYALPMCAGTLGVLIYTYQGAVVGHARNKYNVPAPAMTGHKDFERCNRVHLNTGEQLVVFLPSLAAFSTLVSPKWGGAIGFVWCGARLAYGYGYYRDPKKREAGAVATFLCQSVLMCGVAYVAGKALVESGRAGGVWAA